jgi:predicted DNA binding protein
MIQAFGEINDLLKRFIPELTEISNTGTIKNNLILNQKETINKFVNDDIFKREIEMLDASLKIRDMLIRNFSESVLSHVILGGVSDFFNNEHEKAIKKLSKAKYLTFYESRLFEKLKNGELEGFDASPFREARYKDYTKVAKKRTYSLGKNGTLRFLLTSLLLTPFTTAVIFLFYLLFSSTLFNKSILFMNCDIYSLITLLIAGTLVAELLSLNFSQKIFKFFKKDKNKKEEAVTARKKSPFMKISAILTETIAIILLFSAVNNSVTFYENRVSFAEDSAISLRQNSIKYEYIDTVYKADGFYFNDNFFESEHYILVSKNGDRIDTGYYLNNANSEFEKNVLPLLLKNGCTLKEIKSEEEIK